MNHEKDALLGLQPKSPLRIDTSNSKGFYRNPAPSSLSSIKLVQEQTVENAVAVRKRSRSYTVSADMTPSALNPIQRGKRKLWGQLPFICAFGML